MCHQARFEPASISSEIPLRDRGQWRSFLAEQKVEHQHLTNQIIALETHLNEVVNDAFGLDTAERALIEQSTKYPYGEV